MRWTLKTGVGAIVVASGLATGCTSGWGGGSSLQAPARLSSPTNGLPQTSENSATSLNPVTDGYGQMPVQASGAAAGSGGVVLASLRQAGSSIADAFRIEEKVTPADDPIRLNSGPTDTEKVAADLHYHAGYFFETQGKFHEAAAHYNDAMKRSPKDSRSFAGYGRVQERLGNLIEAEKHLRRAHELSPKDPGPLTDLAQVYAQRGDLPSAIGWQQQAVQLQPSNQLHRLQLAKLFVSSGRNEDAVQLLIPSHGESRARSEVLQLISGIQPSALAAQQIPPVAGFQPQLNHSSACNCPSHAKTAGVTRLPQG